MTGATGRVRSAGLTGTGQLVRLTLRLDRVRLPLWILAITGIVAASASAVQGLYETAEQRPGYAVTAQSPAAIVMSAPPQALDTVGGITVFETTLTALVGVGLMLLAAVIEQRRDLGAGLVASRPGSPRASGLLSSVPGLAWREQWSSVFWWAAGLLLMGLLFGAFGDDVGRLVEDNPAIREAFGPGGEEDLVAGYFGMILLILALVAACFTVGSVHRLHSEESAGRAEYVLATRAGRVRWQLGWLAVTGVGTVVVLLAAALGVVASDALVSGSAERAGELVAATLTYLPAVAVVGGLATALHGWAPRLALVTWVAVAGCFVVGWLGGLLGIPEEVMDLSPFTLTPRMPLEEMDWVVVAGLTGVAAALVVLGVLGLRRRDIVTNA